MTLFRFGIFIQPRFFKKPFLNPFLKKTMMLFLLLSAGISKAQNTYYWVHNDVVTVANQFSKDQVNATNSGAGTAFWKHFSKVSGSTSTLNLVPASTPITSLDNIIVDNNSIPTRTVVSNYSILIDNAAGGLICQDFDASAWNPPAGQLQSLAIQIVTNLQVYHHFRLSPSNKFRYLQGTTLTFPNNSPTAVDSIHLYNTIQQNSSAFRYLGNLNINIFTNGKVYFCDTISSSTANGPAITVRANDNVGLSTEVHFLENINYIATLTVEAGNLFIHKNVNKLRSLRIGGGFGGVNGPSPNTVNSRFYAHAPGFYSSPGVWNPGYWNDPAYTAQGQNVWGRLQSFTANRGLADFQNSRMNDVSINFSGNRGRGTIGSDSVGFLTNQMTYLRFRSAGNTFSKPYVTTGCFSCTGYNFRGTWVIDQNPVVDNVTDYFSTASPQFYHDTFEDTLLVATNLNRFGGSTSPTFSTTIGAAGYARFAAGYSYDFGNPNYVGYPNSEVLVNNGKLVIGDSRGCDSSVTKLMNGNIIMGATGTQTISNTQIEAVRIQGTAAARTILGSNTDMGGNTGFLFALSAGQLTTNGAAPSTAAYAYGTAPYNSVPFTARKARTLIWDDVASGSGTKYWSERKWADAAISVSAFDQCPPTFIDSVIVNPGSTLKIDQRATQCKSFVALAGAPITLSQKATVASDSLSTLQIFGSFILNQKLNNMLNRNILFRAWQTYPQIKTSGTNFWRGLNFWAVNTGTANPNAQTTNGSWTLADSLCAYNQDIVFSPRSNSAPDCRKINFDKITYALFDPVNEFISPGGNNTSVSVYFNYMLYLTAGNLYTNNKNIHTYNFYVNNDSRFRKRLFLGSSVFNLYDGTGELYNVTNNTIYTYASSWVAPDAAASFTLSAGTSHIKFHTKTFMVANAGGGAGANNAATNTFGNKGNRYYNVSFLCNDSTAATYKRSTNILSAPIFTATGGAGITRSGISRSINCNFHNITVWSSDASYPQIQTYRDTIGKLIFKYNAGSLNSAAIITGTFTAGVAVAMSATVTNSSIDSLIFETKINGINSNAAIIGSGHYNVRRYLSFAPGSTNTFNAGDKHRLYSSATVLLGRTPWADQTPAVPPDNPAYTPPPPYAPFSWAPYGAKLRSQAVCDAPTVIRFGGFTNAGNAVAYPAPYHWSGSAPRDTFDVKNLLVIDDSLTQFQTVDATVNLSGSTLNWNAGTFSPRTLVFRDGGTANASWFDKSKWARVLSYTPYTIGAIGECIPQCGDSVIFDNASFSAPTNSCSLGAANSAYCGTMAWRPGVTGIFDGSPTSVLTICNSLYFNATMRNNFLGQTVFTAIDSNRVETIQSGSNVFYNQVLFNARNPSKYKTAWRLLDSLSTLPIANAIVPAMKISAGMLDTRGKNLNLVGGFDISSTRIRGIDFHGSKVYTTGGHAGYAASGNSTAFNIGGDYTRLRFKADSSDIYATSTQSVGINYNANFYVWDGTAASQLYTAAPKGFKFNRITVTAMTSAGSTSPSIYLRSDTVNKLTLTGKTIWYHFYKGYVKSCLSDNPPTGPTQAQIGSAVAVSTPLFRFKGRIDTMRINHRVAATSGQMLWDTLYVKDEMTIQPGSSLQFGKGGLTWFANSCSVQLIGTTALPISLNTSSSIGVTYNYPAPTGNRLQNEHYFRKDSGRVCTDYAQLYNIWAIGNGNGNDNCTGGSAWGCTVGTPAASAYGSWIAPVMSPTAGVRTLADTTFYSSETPSYVNSGRARFLAGSNADYGYPNPVATHNAAGWDGSPYAGFPGTQLSISQRTICPGTQVTATLALTGPLKSSDFPITATYSLGGVSGAYTFTSATNNPYVFTFTPTATTQTNVTWVNMENTRCFNSLQPVAKTENIYFYPTPDVLASSTATVSCAGSAVTLSASGANTYTWSTGQNTASISANPTVTTTYSVVGTNTLGCTNSPPIAITVQVNALPTLSVSGQSNVACFGNASGSVTLTPVGGSGSSYSVSPSTMSGLSAGTYSYTVKDGAGCTSTVIPITITQPPSALSATGTASNNTSCASPNGQLSVSPGGGTSGYTYTWLPGGETTALISNKTGGTYTVIVTDANNCSYSLQSSISNPAAPLISATGSAATICSGGSMTLTPAGGTTYTIIPSAGTPATGISGPAVLSPTVSTSYSVTGTNATGCPGNTVSLSVSVTASPTVSIAGVTGAGVICSGTSATITPSGAATYTLLNTGLSGTSFTVSPAANTTYSISGSASGCPGNTALTTITVNATPTVAITGVSGSGVLCSGTTVTITPGGATTYTLLNTGATGTSFTVSPSANTSYSITGSSAGCTGNTANTTLTVNATPTVAVVSVSGSGVICSGASAVITPGGASTYTLLNTGATGTSFTVTPSANATYSVSGSASGCNGNMAMTTVTVNITPTVSIGSAAASLCAGQSLTLTASGASTYTWTGQGTSSGTLVVSPAATTVYTVQGTSSNCNSAQASATVIVNQVPVLAVASVTNVSCFGLSNGSAAFTSSGGTPGYTVTGTGVSGNNASGLAPGSYTYTVRDAAGCANTATLSVTQPVAALTSTAVQTSANTSCTNGDGVASVSYSGGTPGYTITAGSGTVAGSTITGLNTGPHTFTVTDARGCASANSVSITGSPGISSSVPSQANVACFGAATASIIVAGSNEPGGSYTYSITPVSGGTVALTSNTSGQFTGLSAGSYSVLITGAGSHCTSTQTISITQPASALALTGLSTGSVVCSGGTAQASATVSGGTAPYTYAWSSNTGTTSTVSYPAGSYSLTVRDANNCTVPVRSFTIQGAAPLTISSVATTTTGCGMANANATVTPSGGWNSAYTYTISNSAGTVVGNTMPASGLSAGSYTAIVADALGCTTSTVFLVSNPTTPTISIASPTAAICAGNTVTLSPTGAQSYTVGSTAFTATVALSPSATTVYQVTGTDAANCVSAPLSVTVTVYALPSLTLSLSSASLCAGATATLTAAGATSYTWANAGLSGSTATVAPSATTVYSVTGSDASTGCVGRMQTVSLQVNPLPAVAVASQTNVLCFGNASGAVTFTAGGASIQVSPSPSALPAGAHTFTVTDLSTGCASTASVTITGPLQALTAAVSGISANTSCQAPVGSFSLSASGGTPAYTYGTGNTSGIFSNQATGTHTVQVSDANGCTYTLSATVPGVPSPVIASSSYTNALCNGEPSGAAMVSVSGGTQPYTYSWTGAPGTGSTISHVGSGTYVVTVTDQGNCTVRDTFRISAPPAIQALTSGLTEPCIGEANGSVSIELSGGTPAYSVSWTPSGAVASAQGNSATLSEARAGQYIALIRDANGCGYSYPVQLDNGLSSACEMTIPEIFSPNGDGKNDTWEVKGLENYPGNRVTIFNRWGDEVFGAAPYANDWDGTNTGDKSLMGKGALPAGTYYFVLELGNGSKPVTGYVQLTK